MEVKILLDFLEPEFTSGSKKQKIATHSWKLLQKL